RVVTALMTAADALPGARFVTTSAAETEQLGRALARLLQAGDVVVLVGELGAGKTVFARGIARGLDVDAPVTSPTFTLAHRYAGRIPMVHVDVYRLDRLAELDELDLDEDEDAVLVVEWGDVVAAALPSDRLVVALEPASDAVDTRRVVLTPEGGAWRGRAPEL